MLVKMKCLKLIILKSGEREFFVPVRDSNKQVIGYFERHEMPWDESNPKVPVTEYWKHRR